MRKLKKFILSPRRDNWRSVREIKRFKYKKVYISEIDGLNIGSHLRNSLVVDKNNTTNEAIMDIYRLLRPGEPSL